MRVEGMVLAGGKSRRMGGHHKGNLCYHEQSFQDHVIAEFRKLTDRILLSYGTVIHKEYPDCETIKDVYPEIGPIGGLYSGLKQSKAELLMVAACDMPLLDARLYQYLLKKLSEEENRTEDCYDGVVPVTGEKMHLLAAVYRKSALMVLEKQIKERNYRVTDAVKAMNILYIDITEEREYEKMLRNINTEEEYQKLVMNRE